MCEVVRASSARMIELSFSLSLPREVLDEEDRRRLRSGVARLSRFRICERGSRRELVRAEREALLGVRCAEMSCGPVRLMGWEDAVDVACEDAIEEERERADIEADAGEEAV